MYCHVFLPKSFVECVLEIVFYKICATSKIKELLFFPAILLKKGNTHLLKNAKLHKLRRQQVLLKKITTSVCPQESITTR